MTAQQLIDHLKLVPLPVEGGLFRQSYKASETIARSALPPRYGDDKPFGVAIYYLLTDHADSFSAMHKLPTDEIYHFYLGDPVELLQLYPDGASKRVILGQDILHGQSVQYVAPRNVWMGAHLLPHLSAGGRWALLGTTMAPGFSDSDYVGGERAALISQYPHEAELIAKLTRVL